MQPAVNPVVNPSTATLDIIEKLIAIPTVSRDSNLGLIEWVRDELARQGVKSRLTYNDANSKANLFATIGPEDRPGVALSGHTDVVPVDGQDWTSDPFVPTVRDGRLYARGAADMKSFIGTVLAQVPQFLAADLKTPVHLALSYDEEIGCVGVRRLIDDLAAAGIRPAGCIVGEPTSMNVVTAHKAQTQYRCRVHGHEAHSSLTPHAVNAIEYAARIVCRIRDIADRLRASGDRIDGFDVPFTTLQTGVIRGGTATNIVPRDCQFNFEFRCLPGADPQHLFDEVRAYAESLLPEMRAVAPQADITWELLASAPACDTSERAAIYSLAQALSRGETGRKVAYATEAGLFHQAGIPTIVCGPGSIEQAHKPNEYIELAQIAACERFVGKLIAELGADAPALQRQGSG
jgi:acetylornithine deacetylase